jgi:hypothetical protein
MAEFNWTAVQLAIRQGHEEVVARFLDSGVGNHPLDSSGRSLLHDAARSGRSDVVKMMLEAKLFVQIKDQFLKPSTSGVASDLLGDDEWPFLRFNIDYRDNNGHTPLHEAVLHNQIGAVETLLDHGASARIRDTEGNTALHLAAAYGGVPIIDQLLGGYRSTKMRNRAHETPEIIAKRLQKKDIAKRLKPRFRDKRPTLDEEIGDGLDRTIAILAASLAAKQAADGTYAERWTQYAARLAAQQATTVPTTTRPTPAGQI